MRALLVRRGRLPLRYVRQVRLLGVFRDAQRWRPVLRKLRASKDRGCSVSDTQKPKPKPQLCVACGEISYRGRWCSERCFREEDYHWEPAEQDAEEGEAWDVEREL